jgi:hypothetical protein
MLNIFYYNSFPMFFSFWKKIIYFLVVDLCIKKSKSPNRYTPHKIVTGI